MKRKLYTFLPVGIILLLVITNPSVKDFKDHLGKTSYQGLIREHNFFLWSEYIDKTPTYSYAVSKHYFAIFGNFFTDNLSAKSNTSELMDSAKMDTAKIVTDTAKDPFAKYGGHEIK